MPHLFRLARPLNVLFMNVNALIEAIVRQTTVLIATLATSQGIRAPLAHTADQVFADLVVALKEQGLGNKVIADMFGMALRTYHDRVRRASESQSFRGRTLWQALLEYIQSAGPVLRADVLRRFAGDDPTSVRTLLRDLTDSGLVFRGGKGDATLYRAADEKDLKAARPERDEGIQQLVWIAIHQRTPTSRSELQQALSLDEQSLDAALRELVAAGNVRCSERDGVSHYDSRGCVLAYDDPVGFEAAIFDHYQAVVSALCSKLRAGRDRAQRADWVGGSTYSFEVWPGHPHFEEATGFLSSMRERATDLRKVIADHNVSCRGPALGRMTVSAYLGQSVTKENGDEV